MAHTPPCHGQSATMPGLNVIVEIMQPSGTNRLRDLLLCPHRTRQEKWRASELVGPEERLQRPLGNAPLEFIEARSPAASQSV